MDFSLFYMTCADGDEARRIVSALLEARLIACANIMPPHTALYRWEGKVAEGRECGVIMKGRSDMADRIGEMVRGMHGYGCPCLVALPIQGGLGPFLQWIGESVAA